MGWLKIHDVPFLLTGCIAQSVYEDIFDKCPGHVECESRDSMMGGCSLQGKHLNKYEKFGMGTGYTLLLPFAIAGDAVLIGTFPLRITYRTCKYCVNKCESGMDYDDL